jgi:hypothetical protein
VPRCAVSSREFRGSLADCRGERKKSFSCVTTRGRNLGINNGLGRGLVSLTALSLGLGVAAFGWGGLATLRLAPCRLPAAYLPLAFRLLTIALVPASWLVLAPAPFAQACPEARSAHSGRTGVLSLNVMGAHGSCNSQGKSSGRMCNHSPRALSKRELGHFLTSLAVSAEQDQERNGFLNALQKETTGSTTGPVALPNCSEMAPKLCAPSTVLEQ